MYEDILKILKENPKCHIDYHDNGGWTIYSEKPKDTSEMDYDEEMEYLGSLVLMEGDDFTYNDGYCSSLVKALAEMSGFTTDSI